MSITFPRLLLNNYRESRTKCSMRVKRLGVWEAYDWNDLVNETALLVASFGTLSFEKGFNVAVIASNTPETIIACDAIQIAGNIPAIIHPDVEGDTLQNMLTCIDAQYAFVDSQQQVDALLALKNHSLKKIIYVSPRGLKDYDKDLVISYKEFLSKSQTVTRLLSAQDVLVQESRDIQSTDPAFIFFSSGTGEEKPKAIPLTHENLVTATKAVQQRIYVNNQDNMLLTTSLAILPNFLLGYALNHCYQVRLECPESRETVLDNMCEVNPTILSAQPHVYRYIMMLINKRMGVSEGLISKLYHMMFMNKQTNTLKIIGTLYHNNKGNHIGGLIKRFMNALIFSPIKDIYGLSRLRCMVSSGETLNESTHHFFKVLDIPLVQMYDSVEASGCISLQRANDTSADHSGSTIGEVKLSADGEILYRGDNVFSGYLNDQTLTNQNLRDGWFYTGDYGRIEEDNVVVIDRIDALGTLSTGDRFSPKDVEKHLSSVIQIKDAVVVGEGRPFLCALIVISEDVMGLWADRNDIRYAGFDDLTTKLEVAQFIGSEIHKAVENVQHKVQKFVLLPRDFSIAVQEKTYTGKPRRLEIAKHFKPVIDAIYDNQSKVRYQDATHKSDSEVAIHVVK